MPNWIEGTLKLRGTTENLKRFIKNGLGPSGWFPEEEKLPPISDFVKLDDFEEFGEATIVNEPHIKGTRRAFILDTTVWIDDDTTTLCLPIKQAWAFCADENDRRKWQDLSKEFGLDIRLYGFERGMEFCEEIEIIDGKITLEKEIQYNDWLWECPMPLLGG